MTNRRRTLAGGFADVAGTPDVIDAQSAYPLEMKEKKPRPRKKAEAAAPAQETSSTIQSLLDETSNKKAFVGIYFDADVAEALASVTKGKKGALSKIVNEAVKQLLQGEGLL